MSGDAPLRPDDPRRVEEDLRRLRESPLGRALRKAGEEIPCPPPEALDRFRRGEMAGAEADDLTHHLLGCAACGADVLARDRVEREAERGPGGAVIALRLFRRPALAGAAAAAILIAGAVIPLVLSGRSRLLDAELVGDRGLVRGGAASLERGERLRLRLRLGAPAAVLVVLEDPRGSLADICPEPGGIPLSPAAGDLLLPAAGGAWDTGGLERGTHALWVAAARAPMPPGERAAVLARLAEVLRGRPPRPEGRADLAPAVRRAFGEGVEVAERAFRIE